MKLKLLKGLEKIFNDYVEVVKEVEKEIEKQEKEKEREKWQD